MDPITIAAVIALGALVGFLVGLTSVGSGSILTPILYLDFSSSLSTLFVVGTSTTEGTITKFIASARNYLRNTLRKDYAFIIAITGVPTAAVGAFFSADLITWNLFQPILAAVLIAVAIAIIYDAKFRNKKNEKKLTDPKMDSRLKVKGMAVGLVVGLIAGFTGVSTGSLLVASLIVFMGFSPRTAVTIAVFEGGIILLAATIVQLYLGHVNFLFTGLLVLGGIPAILVGSHFKDRVNQRLLGYGVAGLIIFESARTLSQFFWGKKFFFF